MTLSFHSLPGPSRCLVKGDSVVWVDAEGLPQPGVVKAIRHSKNKLPQVTLKLLTVSRYLMTNEI
jgi:hypothetical protein